MNEESKVKKFWKKLKSVKHIEIIIAVIAIIVMLTLYFSTKVAKPKAGVSSNFDYCKNIETRLEGVISSVSGAGKAKIIINWESSAESIIAYIESSSGTNSNKTPQIISSNAPIVLKEVYPKAIGVIIICQGGNNIKIKMDITRAVAVLLDITQDKISVLASK